MQEEIEHKTVNFAISTAKLSARTLLRGAQFFLRQYDKSASQGKQSMKRLIRQNRGVTNLEIEKTGILSIVIFVIVYALMKSKIIGVCPNCGKPVVEREKGWFCENRECRFVLWKDNAFFKRLGKRLDAHVADKLLRDGRVRLKDCKSAKGKTYNATVLLSCEADGRSKFSLEFEGGC